MGGFSSMSRKGIHVGRTMRKGRDTMGAVESADSRIPSSLQELEALVLRTEQEREQLAGTRLAMDSEMTKLRAAAQEKERAVEELQRALFEREVELNDNLEKWRAQQKAVVQQHAQLVRPKRPRESEPPSSSRKRGCSSSRSKDSPNLTARLAQLEQQCTTLQQRLQNERKRYNEQLSQHAELTSKHHKEKASPGTPSSSGSSASVTSSTSSRLTRLTQDLGSTKNALKTTKAQLERASQERSRLQAKLTAQSD
eukprot:RCo001015